MEDLIRANALSRLDSARLVTNEDETGADDVSEIIEDEEEVGGIDEEDGGMDAEMDQWQ